MGFLDLFSKKQQEKNQAFLADQRGKQAINKIKKLDLPIDIKQQLIANHVFDIWFNDKDLAPLAALSETSEQIQYGALAINEQSHDVLLVCSNQHLLILEKGQSKFNQIALKEIKSVIVKSQFVYDDLALVVGNETLDFNSINKTAGSILAETIKKWAQKAVQTPNLDQQVQQIKQLKELLDQGILTQEEFQAKKKQILDI